MHTDRIRQALLLAHEERIAHLQILQQLARLYGQDTLVSVIADIIKRDRDATHRLEKLLASQEHEDEDKEVKNVGRG